MKHVILEPRKHLVNRQKIASIEDRDLKNKFIKEIPEMDAILFQICGVCTGKNKSQVLHVLLYLVFALHLLEISNLQPCLIISNVHQLKKVGSCNGFK